jgi:serine protease Do
MRIAMSGFMSRLHSRSSRTAILARASAFGAVIAMTVVPSVPLTISSAQAQESPAGQGPSSLAPLVGQVMDAVVNIKASQTVEAKSAPAPDNPGGPMDELFNDFFNKRGEGPGGNGGPQQRRGNSLGSGFVIDPSGIIVTNNHVIADANDVVVVFNDRTELKAKVLGKDPKVDLAVLKVESPKPLKSVKFGDSGAAKVGDWVLAIGNPFGFGGSVSVGIVSARNRQLGSGPYDSYLQTDAAINRGNSGGPLFNMSGDVIGINTAIVSPSGGSIGIGFSVPSALAMPIIDQLREFGETRRGWLGVRIQDVDEAIAESLNMDRPRGAMVAGVEDSGPAKPAGIESGDVIIKFDGKDVDSSRDLPRIVAETPVGKEVPVIVLRKGVEVTKSVKLGRLEEGEKLIASASGTDNGKADTSKPVTVLGMELSMLTKELREKYKITAEVNGVAITKVDPNANAAERRIEEGNVIVEVAQEAVSSGKDVSDKIEKLKKDGKKVALLAVANGKGDLRYVAVQID